MSQHPPEYSTPPARPSPNWVLLGCGGCLGLIVLLAIGIGALTFFGVKAVKGSSVYAQAVKAAKESPAVQEELGVPITEGAFPTGAVQIVNDKGSADFRINISGPKGRGIIHYRAERDNSDWRPTEHAVLIEKNNRTIDLTQ